MTNIICKILVLLNITSSYASVPTVEGLLRNPSNGDITQKTAVVRFSIERKSEAIISEVDDVNLSKKTTHYVKYIFDTNLRTRVRAIQAVYKTKEMRADDLVSVRYFSDLADEKLLRENRLFLAVLSSLTLNRSEELMNYLKGISKDVKYNKESYDEEKKRLMTNYKSYLVDKKEDSETEKMNPLKPELLEEKERVSEVMRRPLFVRSGATKLKKKNKEFYWEVILDNFQGEFENENLKVRKMEFNNLSSIDQFTFENFLLIDGIHSFPKRISMTLLDKKYKIEVLRMIHIESKNKSINNRVKEYNKKLSSNNIKDYVIDYPFL